MSHLEHRVYSDEQYHEIGAMGAWNILLDIHNAIAYGFTDCRLPEPGRPISVDEAESHVVNIEKEWLAEKLKRDFSNEWTGAPPFTSMTTNTKLYLHSVLRDEWDNVNSGVKTQPLVSWNV